MPIDLSKFAGTLPYDSQMYGIYQPLLGWKSSLQVSRLLQGLTFVRQRYLGDLAGRFRGEFAIQSAVSDAPAFTLGLGKLGASLRPQTITGLDSLLTRRVLKAISSAGASNPDAWKKFTGPDFLQESLHAIEGQIKSEFLSTLRQRLQASSTGMALAATGSEQAILAAILQRESVSAGVLAMLNQSQPPAMLQVLLSSYGSAEAKYHIDPGFLDPAKSDMARAVISPIGIVHLFREYFFEFATFLGSPVQHVWLSPGGTVELVEISTRKTTVERTIEQSFDSIQKSEKDTTTEDELSDAVKQENSSDTKLGVTANSTTNYSVGFVSGSVSVTGSYSLDRQQKEAREQTHKSTRQQTQKLSSEIRQSFKSTFKTVTETADTTSKRYLLQNSTDNLVNYELRRKMRQVGVQIQDYGTRLCWQAYVDNPGDPLGIALFVHVADLPDLQGLKSPDQVPQPEPIVRGDAVSVPLKWRPTDDTYYKFVPMGPPITIVPPSGYICYHADTHIESGPSWGIFALPNSPDDGSLDTIDGNFPITNYRTDVPAPDGSVEHSITSVQPGVMPGSGGISDDRDYDWTVQVTPLFRPSKQLVKDVDDKNAENLKTFTEQKKQAFQEALFKSIRDRVKLASNIQPRGFADLREEERVIVFRNLIQQLLVVAGVGSDDSHVRHVFSEVVESMFDMDNMLYFVSPDWWMPRKQVTSTQALKGLGLSDAQDRSLFEQGSTDSLMEADVVKWGGARASRRDNYYITEDSAPAKLGSSLGWLLQLDGDNFRNAFLNAPWVKAVIPIREGHEWKALDWLSSSSVEGSDGLDDLYQEAFAGERAGMIAVLQEYTNWPDPALGPRYEGLTPEEFTIRDAIRYIIVAVQQKQLVGQTKVNDPEDETLGYLPTDKVFEHGFDPLQGGFVAQAEQPFEIFDQWIEVLPTDQIVPVEVAYNPKTGQQI
jgi:hypothetical protein